MLSRNAMRALAPRVTPPAEVPPAAGVWACESCQNRAICAIARYTDGEVAICSRWEERKSAA